MRGLAEQIGVTVASLSEWNTGKRPIPDDRIQQLAKIAGQDAGPWLLLIHSEQDQGELGREWAKLYKRLAGAAMALFLMFGAMMPKPVKASEISSLQAGEWQQCILCYNGGSRTWNIPNAVSKSPRPHSQVEKSLTKALFLLGPSHEEVLGRLGANAAPSPNALELRALSDPSRAGRPREFDVATVSKLRNSSEQLLGY